MNGIRSMDGSEYTVTSNKKIISFLYFFDTKLGKFKEFFEIAATKRNLITFRLNQIRFYGGTCYLPHKI